MKKNIKNSIVILTAIIFYFLFKNIMYSTIILAIYIIVEINKSSIEKKKMKELKKEKEYEFANLLSYLLVFLENNFNVYQSLKMAMGYCKEYLANDIEKLLNEIDLDKSIVPYQNFANQFDSVIVYQVVMMIYQLDINGYDAKYLNNFPSLIENMKQAKIESIINARKMNMSFLTIVPIVALLIVVFSLVFFILVHIGGNVI